MKILLDTNVWRYLVDSKRQNELHLRATSSGVQIAVAPSVVIETLRMGDPALRKNIVEIQTRDCWKRLMPDAYLECEDMKREILRCRPHWALPKNNASKFKNLRYDWLRSRGGFWHKARTETDAIAADYSSSDSSVLETTRQQAKDVRDAVQHGQAIVGKKKLTKIPGSWTTLNGEKVETDFWRVHASAVYETMMTQNTPFQEWLSCDIDINRLYYGNEYSDFFANEVKLSAVPRAWIRAAMFALQSERTVNDGTPTDAAIAVHLIDVDFIVSADKNFVSIVNRCHDQAPFKMGNAFRILGGEDGIEQLFKYIADARATTKKPRGTPPALQ